MPNPGFAHLVTVAAVVESSGGFASAADRVTVDNFTRVESDLYFSKFVADNAFEAFTHAREPVLVDKQDVIRMNRDTLYSYGVADLSAGPVTVTLPSAEDRFVSLPVINEDHYTPTVVYDPGDHTFTQEQIGTAYVLFLVRTFVDPQDATDLDSVHALQDAMKISQGDGAAFEVPDWNTDQATALRNALNAVAAASGRIDSARMFGAKGVVDPVQHLIGTAAGQRGNPLSDAYYAGVTPEKNDGETISSLVVQDVPVDGFWSISVYNADGFFEKNDWDRYSLNNVTAEKSRDGSVEVQFGGCTADLPNCLPTTDGWNYLVRMYRPRAEILDGPWTFPEAVPVE